MKCLFVTSELTYVPNNYWDALSPVIYNRSIDTAGVAFVRVLSWSLIPKIMLLYLTGCPRTATTIIKNIASLISDGRTKELKRLGLPAFKLRSMNDPFIIAWVIEHKIDLVINLRTRDIYQSEILDAPKIGCINIHHGLLPQYRGMYCDLYALAAEREAGYTLHQMENTVDSGGIIFQKTISNSEKNYMQYLARAAKDEGMTLLDLLQNGELPACTPNMAAAPIYSRTPSWRQLRAMRQAGMKL